jgi:hypothetical protein
MRYSKIAPRHGYGPQARAIGSAGERLVHTEEVTGSIPVSPTSSETQIGQARDHMGPGRSAPGLDVGGSSPSTAARAVLTSLRATARSTAS